MPPFRVRKVIAETEAHLAPVPGCEEAAGAKAKIERKRYSDGGDRLKLRVRRLSLDDQAVALFIAGKSVAEVEVRGGRARLDIDGDHTAGIPAAEPGDTVELRLHGAAILAGKFSTD